MPVIYQLWARSKTNENHPKAEAQSEEPKPCHLRMGIRAINLVMGDILRNVQMPGTFSLIRGWRSETWISSFAPIQCCYELFLVLHELLRLFDRSEVTALVLP